MKVRRLKYKRPTRDEPQTCIVTLTDALPLGRRNRMRWTPEGGLEFLMPYTPQGCGTYRVHLYSSELK
jgi:hypothetical protein